MKTLKDPLYWQLMPPFLIAAILLVYYLPDTYKPCSFLAIILFWIVYYYCRNKKEKKIDE